MPIVSRPFTLPPNLFNKDLYTRILQLWFTDLSTTASTADPSHFARWYGVGPSSTPQTRAAFDTECRSLVLPALESISPATYNLSKFSSNDGSDLKRHSAIASPFLSQLKGVQSENEQASNALALVLLLDQMPRNCFRGDQKVIYSHYDRIARAVADAIFERALDKAEVFKDSPPWRGWFFMPLMHSEVKEDHRLLEGLLKEVRGGAQEREDEAAVGYMTRMIDFEEKHRRIIERFGRYPHRNAVLGRDSTVEEQKWLEDGGDTFGT